MKPADQADRLRLDAALRALDYVRDGMVLGLGSGRTAEMFVAELAKRVQDGLRVVGVPTSRRIETLAGQLGVPLASLDEQGRVDLIVDGADEIDPQTFDLIKGGGGSLLREKLVASASEQEIIIADESKLVAKLGGRRPVPVEVVRFGHGLTAEALERLGCTATLREADGGAFVSDEGHYIYDCAFPPIDQPARLAEHIKATVGVVEHGLFIGLADRLVIAGAEGVRVFERPSG
jgi:ribose 5-phosphate isomerase A